MQVILGFILLGAFALTAAIVEGDLPTETKRLSQKKRQHPIHK